MNRRSLTIIIGAPLAEPTFLSETEKQILIARADREIGVPFYNREKLWLAAIWIDAENVFRPTLVTPAKFYADERLRFVSRSYRPKRFVPHGFDTEKSSRIVSGSIDPKTGRRRIIRDPTKGEVQAAPIPNQVDWSTVPEFRMPDLNSVPGWSKAKDDAVTKALEAEGFYKPEDERMASRFEKLNQQVVYNKKLVPHRHLDSASREMHLRFPESRFDQWLSNKVQFNFEFERLQSTSTIFEFMRAGSPDMKTSMLRTLNETGQLDILPFKVRVTALLLSRGITTKETAQEVFLDQVLGLTQISRPAGGSRQIDDEDFRRFSWIYSEHDFQRYRSVVESLLAQLAKQISVNHHAASSFTVADLWSRFKTAWEKLSKKQREAAELLHMDVDSRTNPEVSEMVEIKLSSLRDRWAGTKKRFRKMFPDFKGFYPSKSHTNSNKREITYGGFRRTSSAKFIHPVKISSPRSTTVQIVLPKPYKGPQRQPTPEITHWLNEHRMVEQSVARMAGTYDRKVSKENNAEQFQDEPDKTLDLWDVYRPGRKKFPDLALESPATDDAAIEPLK